MTRHSARAVRRGRKGGKPTTPVQRAVGFGTIWRQALLAPVAHTGGLTGCLLLSSALLAAAPTSAAAQNPYASSTVVVNQSVLDALGPSSAPGQAYSSQPAQPVQLPIQPYQGYSGAGAAALPWGTTIPASPYAPQVPATAPDGQLAFPPQQEPRSRLLFEPGAESLGGSPAPAEPAVASAPGRRLIPDTPAAAPAESPRAEEMIAEELATREMPVEEPGAGDLAIEEPAPEPPSPAVAEAPREADTTGQQARDQQPSPVTAAAPEPTAPVSTPEPEAQEPAPEPAAPAEPPAAAPAQAADTPRPEPAAQQAPQPNPMPEAVAALVERQPEPAPEPQAAARLQPTEPDAAEAEPEPEPEQPAASESPAGGAQQAALPMAGGVPEELRLEFEGEAAELDGAMRDSLLELARLLRADEALRVQLAAYASGNAGDASRARRLSLSRALTVRSFLLDQGVRSTRMDVRALGHNAPSGPSDRVDIVTSRS